MIEPCSEDVATDIDIVIAMWVEERNIENLSWSDRCALRKKIYDYFQNAKECKESL